MNIFFFDVYRQCEEEIAVLKTDNEQLEREKSDYKERLKQLTKTKLVDDLIQKKTGVAQRLSGVLSKKSMMIYFLHFFFFFIQIQQLILVQFHPNVNYHPYKSMIYLRLVNKKYE